MDAGRAIGLVWPIRAQPGDPRLAWGPGRGICPQGVGTLRSSSRYMDVMSRGDPGSGRVVSEGDSGNRDLPGLGAPCTVTAFEPRVADTWTPGFLSTQGAGGQNGTLSHNETKRSLGVPASQQVWAWLLHAVSSLCARPPLCPRSLQALRGRYQVLSQTTPLPFHSKGLIPPPPSVSRAPFPQSVIAPVLSFTFPPHASAPGFYLPLSGSSVKS